MATTIRLGLLVPDGCSDFRYKTLHMITMVLLFLFSWVVGFSAYGEKLQHEYLAPLSLADFISSQPPRPGRREDGSANFTIMRSRGGPFGQSRETNRTSLVLDALSIGTKYNQLLLEAQQKTWASHRAVRHYFAATELDDADPMCYKTLNRSTIGKIVHLCKKEQPYAKGSMKIQYEEFVKGGFLRKGPGWMCAQQRFAIAWEKIGRLYRHQLEVDKYALPDFLLFQDDDTYYNIPRIQEFLREKDPNVPLAEAPCLLLQSHTHNFSFPWGGFGFILSKGAIDNLIRPIYCNNTEKDDFEEKVCDRLEDDIIGERRYFRDGMSVSDLMGAQVRNNLFSHFSKTDWVYCLHGDWAVGYFVNFYYISSHIDEPGFENITEARIGSSLGIAYTRRPGDCRYNSIEKCFEKSHVCHRQNAESMDIRTQEVAAKNPGEFRNYK